MGTDADVDDLVNRLFLSDESRKEANLKFIQDRILGNAQVEELLKTYKSVRRSKIRENGQSILHNQLMLSGILASRNGYLETRITDNLDHSCSVILERKNTG